MKNLILILVAFFAVQSFASKQVVSFETQVFTALNPNLTACEEAVSHHNDVVAAFAKNRLVRFFAVADEHNCSNDDLVDFVNNKAVQVIVDGNILNALNVTDYNQTVVDCVRVVRVGRRVVSNVVARRLKLVGLLTGTNVKKLNAAVSGCK